MHWVVSGTSQSLEIERHRTVNVVRPPNFTGNLITGKVICLSHTTEKEPGEEPKCLNLLFGCFSFTLHPAFPGSAGEKLRGECLGASVTECRQLDRPAEFPLTALEGQVQNPGVGRAIHGNRMFALTHVPGNPV